MTPSGSFRTQTTLVELGKVSCADPCLSFTCRVQTAQCDPHIFTLDRDQYVDGPLPSDLPPAFVQSWLPWPLSTRDDTEFSLARHRCAVQLFLSDNKQRYDTIRYDTIRYDTIRYDTIRYDTIRYDTIRYDTIRYDNL